MGQILRRYWRWYVQIFVTTFVVSYFHYVHFSHQSYANFAWAMWGGATLILWLPPLLTWVKDPAKAESDKRSHSFMNRATFEKWGRGALLVLLIIVAVLFAGFYAGISALDLLLWLLAGAVLVFLVSPFLRWVKDPCQYD